METLEFKGVFKMTCHFNLVVKQGNFWYNIGSKK